MRIEALLAWFDGNVDVVTEQTPETFSNAGISINSNRYIASATTPNAYFGKMLTRQIDMRESGTKIEYAIAQRALSLAAIYDHLFGNGLSRTIDFELEFHVTIWIPTALSIIVAKIERQCSCLSRERGRNSPKPGKQRHRYHPSNKR
jgi:hypothetical protein